MPIFRGERHSEGQGVMVGFFLSIACFAKMCFAALRWRCGALSLSLCFPPHWCGRSVIKEAFYASIMLSHSFSVSSWRVENKAKLIDTCCFLLAHQEVHGFFSQSGGEK